MSGVVRGEVAAGGWQQAAGGRRQRAGGLHLVSLSPRRAVCERQDTFVITKLAWRRSCLCKRDGGELPVAPLVTVNWVS